MKSCDGPCDQGRKPCPCPPACVIDVEDPPKPNHMRVVLTDLVIAIMIVALTTTVVLGLLEMAP